MRIPGATYRLQFNADFGFAAAESILGYLRDLGITDCYASPLFHAGPTSTHGYDVCGFDEVNSRLGGEEGFIKFTASLKNRGMGLLLDMVPNHMGNGSSNKWWVDVLRNGEQSAYANWFDIDWEASREWSPGQGQVLLPILEARYGEVLQAGKLRIVSDRGGFFVQYYENKFPLSEESIREIQRSVGESPEAPGFEDALNRRLVKINGTQGRSESFKELHRIIRNQHYRLAFWRIAPEEINYRRFFDVTELISMRMEARDVFEATHNLVRAMLERRQVTGLRIDHPDGLLDPLQYFNRLQRDSNTFIVAEKILTGNETLPKDWPVQGTTGYDFIQRVTGLFVQVANENTFNHIYTDFTKEPAANLPELISTCKRLVLERSFKREINALTKRLRKLCRTTLEGLDFTLSELRAAITNTAVAFPVYRTYVSEGTAEISEADRSAVQSAISGSATSEGSHPEALGFLKRILLREFPADFTRQSRDEAVEFIYRFQQLTSPLMAKGLEDTAFYRYNRLISLNEVGGDPARFGITPEQFHQYNSRMLQSHPHTLIATSTHDTKRSEDVRARLNVLSEIPVEWKLALNRWHELSKRCKTRLHDGEAPDSNDEYFVYQTLVGAWPIAVPGNSQDFTERMVSCISKSIREAKRHTSWTDPNRDYEAATEGYIRKLLSQEAFLKDFVQFQRLAAFHGSMNSLSQTLLKLTSPGVPDFYQGTELWDLSLVDPDNRRSVDYEIRQSMLIGLKARIDSDRRVLLRDLLENWRSGCVKLFLIWQALALRNSKEAVFKSGDYVPLQISGRNGNHVCAFARVSGREATITIVPRFTCTLVDRKEHFPIGGDFWGDTTLQFPKVLPKVHDVLTLKDWTRKNELLLGDVLSDFPVALLAADL